MRGRFIALEGGEACGKSTQAHLLAERLGALHTRQPGGTEIGSEIRRLVLDTSTIGLDPRAETLLMAADRAQHVAALIRLALGAGRAVVTARYAGGTTVFQGFAPGLAVDANALGRQRGPGGLWPDLVVFLDVPLEVAAQRLSGTADRMERAGDEFHRRVLEGFRAIAVADTESWVVVDGTGSVEEVAAHVHRAVVERLGIETP